MMTAIRMGLWVIIMGSPSDLVKEHARFMNCCGSDGNDAKGHEGMITRS